MLDESEKPSTLHERLLLVIVETAGQNGVEV
jgi:hypothetical protein